MKRWHKSFDWNSMRQYTRMQPASRLLFHGIYAMLQGRPYVEADIPQLKCWLTLDRDYVRRALPSLHESGLLVIEELPGGEYRFSLSDELAELCGVSRVRCDNVVSTQRVRSDSVASTRRVRSDDVVSTKRVRSVASSNDAGLKPANLPLEEKRIDKKRKEEKKIEEKKAPVGAASAEPPLVFGSLTLEEAQDVIRKAHERHPGLQRFKDDRTGEPMDDMLFGAILLWIKNRPRAIELGITSDPGEAVKVAAKKPEELKGPSKVKAERPGDCDEQIWRDWMKVRGRNVLTDTAWGAMLNEASKAGISPAEAVKVCAERGWRGFRADWLTRDKVSRPGRREEVDIAEIWGRQPIYEREA